MLTKCRNFAVDIQQENQVTFEINQPLHVGNFHEDAAGKIPNNALKGDVLVDTTEAVATSNDTVSAIQLLLENLLWIKVFQYESSAICIAETTGSQLTVYGVDQEAEADVTKNGNIADWASPDTFLVGPAFKPQKIHTGSSNPSG